jgi:hypothetical protein
MPRIKALPIDSEYVRTLFDYKDGHLHWKINKGRARIGGTARLNNMGYLVLKFDGTAYLEHRLVWAWHGKEPCETLDHINGDTTDNRIENLRQANNAENLRNTKKPVHNTSGVKGVSWNKQKQKWIVSLWQEGKQKYFGAYDDMSQAVSKIQSVREQMHGAFANNG